MTSSLMQTYARLPIGFTHGEGPWLWGSDGKRYLDAVSGIAVCGLGHAHPRITQAICEQSSKLLHVSNLYQINEQEKLGHRLCKLSGMDKVFLCNSGAEANEASIKLARMAGHKKQLASPKIIVMETSFHGRTLATLSATGNAKVHAGFEPLVEGFIRVPFNDLAAIEAAAMAHDDIVAILVEPVQGEGGVHIPDDDYLPGIRQLCDQHDWLMMLDEVQSGTGRCGYWFAFQQYELTPDVMNLAKGLGNGIPVGACLAHGKAAELFGPGNHGSTFGGNPFASTVASTVLDIIETDQLLENCNKMGQYLVDQFTEAFAGLSGVTEVRGKGLLIGIELNQPCTELVSQALNEQLLINVTANNVIRLLPPLILTTTEADQMVNTVVKLVRQFLST